MRKFVRNEFLKKKVPTYVWYGHFACEIWKCALTCHTIHEREREERDHFILGFRDNAYGRYVTFQIPHANRVYVAYVGTFLGIGISDFFALNKYENLKSQISNFAKKKVPTYATYGRFACEIWKCATHTKNTRMYPVHEKERKKERSFYSRV